MQLRSFSALLLSCLPLSATACFRVEERHEAVSADAQSATDQQKTPELKQVVAGIVDRTNAFRKKHDRQQVKINDKLTATAQYFAHFMASSDKYGHEADGKDPAQRVKEHGYDYCLVAENIAYAFDSLGFATEELTSQFVTGWEQSPEHRKNMLDPDVNETGVAVAQSEESKKYYAVQLFGRPKSAAIEFSIANESGEKVEYEIEGKTFELPPRMIRAHTLCRPEELKPQWEGSKAIKPENGEKLVVVKQGDAIELRKK